MKYDDIDAYKRSGAPHEENDERSSFFRNQGAGLRELAIGAPAVGVPQPRISSPDVAEPAVEPVEPVIYTPISFDEYMDVHDVDAVELHPAEPVPADLDIWSAVPSVSQSLPSVTTQPPFPATEPSIEPVMRQAAHHRAVRRSAEPLTVVLSRSLAAKVFVGVSAASCLMFLAGTFMGLSLGRLFPELSAPAPAPQVASVHAVVPAPIAPIAPIVPVIAAPVVGDVVLGAGDVDRDVDVEAPQALASYNEPVPVITVASAPVVALSPVKIAPVGVDASSPTLFSVQLGAFLVSDNLASMVSTLSGLGLVTHQSQRTDAQGRTWHYVRSKAFSNKEDAAHFAGTLKAQGVSGFVVRLGEDQK